MDFFRKFDASKLRLNLKLAETRLELVKGKKTNDIKRQKVDVGNLLKTNQEELARIRTEHIVVDDFHIEVLGILTVLCALVKERTKLLESSEKIPFDMKESCVTLVYAADRVTDIKELQEIKHQLMLKFKKELTQWLLTDETAKENVNERVYEKLSVKPPNAFIVTSYMKHIAGECGVDWQPSDDFSLRMDHPAAAPDFHSIQPGSGSGIKAPYYVTDGMVGQTATSTTSSLSVEPMFKKGGGGGGGPAEGLSVPKMFTDRPTTPVLGPSTIAAATASKKNQSSSKESTTSEYVVLNDDRLNPPKAPVTQNVEAVPGLDELTRRFEALRKS